MLILSLLSSFVYAQASLPGFKFCINQGRVPFLDQSGINFTQIFTNRIQNKAFLNSTLPQLILLPVFSGHVQTIIECANPLTNPIRLITRGGGHSYTGYSYTTTDSQPFVLLDLVNMNEISLNNTHATFGGGVLVGELYTALSQNTTLAFPASSCPTVGLGGLIQGGGVGSLTRKFGLASDNVVEIKVVTADGALRTVNAVTNEDLFFAIRGGGGGNWGVVTEFTVGLVSVPDTVTLLSFWVAMSDCVAMVGQFMAWAPTATEDLSAFNVVWSGRGCALKGLYLGLPPDISALLKSNMPILNSYTTSTSLTSTKFNANVLASPTSDVSFKAKSSVFKQALNIKALTLMNTTLSNGPTSGYVIIDSYGGVMDQIAVTSSAFPYRVGYHFMLQYQVTFNPSTAASSVAWITSFYNDMTQYVEPTAYSNYLDSSLGEWGNSTVDTWNREYFGSNYPALVSIKSKFDPYDMFRFAQSIPTAVVSVTTSVNVVATSTAALIVSTSGTSQLTTVPITTNSQQSTILTSSQVTTTTLQAMTSTTTQSTTSGQVIVSSTTQPALTTPTTAKLATITTTELPISTTQVAVQITSTTTSVSPLTNDGGHNKPVNTTATTTTLSITSPTSSKTSSGSSILTSGCLGWLLVLLVLL